MSRAPKPVPKNEQQRGAALALFVLMLLIGAPALFYDLIVGPRSGFWQGALPGARGLIGAGAALIVLACAHFARLALVRKGQDKEGGGDARDHA